MVKNFTKKLIFLSIFGFILCINAQQTVNQDEIIKLKDLETQKELEDSKSLDQVVAKAVCPGGGTCNNNGYCGSDGTCYCNVGWGGDDCSYAVTAVPSGGGSFTDQVGDSQWHFYTISTSGTNGLKVTLNQTSSSGDADLYLLMNDIPTKSHYAYRDITRNPSATISVNNAGTGTWYIGVFGYLQTGYTIIISTASSQCPVQNNCNPPNGICVSAGVCQCATGFAGSDCSKVITPISLGNTYTGQVDWMKWVYYSVQISSANDLAILLQQTTSGDADVYVRFNSVPDLWNYDYRDAGVSKNITLNINQPSIGNYFIGVYGYGAVSYTIMVNTKQECPSQCSLHGRCNGNACICNSGYSGTFCQTYNFPMSTGVNYNGFVSGSSWNYYSVLPNTASNLVVRVVQNSTGDCDLYLKNGANPTTFVYDYRDIGFSNSFSISVPNPGTTTWYIGIYGYSSCYYTVSYTVTNQCPNGCYGHGNCSSDGTCICAPGYGGSDCSVSSIPLLLNGVSQTGVITDTGMWSYYQIEIVNTTFLTIVLKETQSVGFLWLYVSKDSTPDTRNYDYSDQETNTNFHPIHIQFDAPTSDTLMIGVYSNPYSGDFDSFPFTLAAWYSPF